MLIKKRTFIMATAAAVLAAVLVVSAVSATGTNALDIAGSTTLGPVVAAAESALMARTWASPSIQLPRTVPGQELRK